MIHGGWNLMLNLTKYNIKRIVDYRTGRRPEIPQSPDQTDAPADLEVTKIASLREMRKKDSIAYGSKAANFGELINAKDFEHDRAGRFRNSVSLLR